MKPKAFVTREIPEAGLDQIGEAIELDVWDGELPPPRDELLKRVKGVDGLLCLLTDTIDKDVIEAAGPQLKVISNYAVGFDNIDVEAATAHGIAVGNTPGVLTDTTADLAFALMMSAARRLPEAYEYVRKGNWKTWGPKLCMGHDLYANTLGLIGYGRIGQAVAKRAQGFDMRVLYFDNHKCTDSPAKDWAECVDLDTVLRESDFISLHVPLTGGTRQMIGEREFKLMKESAVLINTARGPVVDHDALYRALREGEIAYAGLDVTEPEPIPPDHPLLTLDNCLILPHIGSSSYSTRDKMAEMAAGNLAAGLRGERLPHCVNPEVYEKT